MLDFAFDAPVIIEFNGERQKVSLSLALAVAAKLLAKEAVFKISNEQQAIYCSYNGERLYADSRIATVLEEVGVALSER